MTDSEILRDVGISLVDTSFLTILFKAMAQARKDERGRCAKILNDRAKICAKRADESDDEDYRVEMRAQAWTFSVIAQEIIEGDKCAP